MHPQRALVLGLGLALCPTAGCVSTFALRPAVHGTIAGTGTIAQSLNEMDAACQSAQTTEAGLGRCKGPRDVIRAQLRSILASWDGVLR